MDTVATVTGVVLVLVFSLALGGWALYMLVIMPFSEDWQALLVVVLIIIWLGETVLASSYLDDKSKISSTHVVIGLVAAVAYTLYGVTGMIITERRRLKAREW